jgi:hypothetical protein
MRLKGFQWFLSVPATVLYCLATLSLHENSGSPNGIPALAALFCSIFLHSSIALWVLADASRRHRPLPYDFGSFLYFGWPVIVPVYLFSTRGWRGLAPLAWFLLLYGTAAVIGFLPFLI